MRILWGAEAWSDYVWWQTADRQVLRRINMLVKDCLRDPAAGIGKPERLRHELAGWWSRRITDEHRLVYRPIRGGIEIASCRFHYVWVGGPGGWGVRVKSS
jgi:toxin YoeB